MDRRAVRQELRPDPLRRRGVSAVPRHPDLVEVARSGRRGPGRAALREPGLRARACDRVRQPEDADLPGGVPAAVPDERRRAPGAALAARRDLLDHHRYRRRHLGAVRGAAQGRRIRPRAADRRSRLRRHPDRGRRRAAPREPAVTTSRPPPPESAPSRRSRAPWRA